jgi:hypothetical protein
MTIFQASIAALLALGVLAVGPVFANPPHHPKDLPTSDIPADFRVDESGYDYVVDARSIVRGHGMAGAATLSVKSRISIPKSVARGPGCMYVDANGPPGDNF